MFKRFEEFVNESSAPPTPDDMVKGTEIRDKHGRAIVQSAGNGGWVIRRFRETGAVNGDVQVFPEDLRFFTLVKSAK